MGSLMLLIHDTVFVAWCYQKNFKLQFRKR
nr:MAG TPA: hypothetical protein [Caudoviricetes sp.]